MSLIDDIGYAFIRIANKLRYGFPIRLGAVLNIAPEDMGATPDHNHKGLENMVAEAAYYRAGQRGFAVGDELHDWLEAEKEILARFNRN